MHESLLPEEGGTLKRTIHEVVHYPKHEPREATALYKANHHRMVVAEDRPCMKCGVRNSTLGDPAHNPTGATHMELHHCIVEYSLANAIDPEKWNTRLRPHLAHNHPHEPLYKRVCTHEEILAWIHGHQDNLWVLCENCHRHPELGIHWITFPVWSVENLIYTGYDLTGFVAESPHEAVSLTNLPSTIGTALSPSKEHPLVSS